MAVSPAPVTSPLTPALILGIDGVIVPLRTTAPYYTWKDWSLVPLHPNAFLSQAMADALAHLSPQRVWLTRRYELARNLETVLGWPSLPILAPAPIELPYWNSWLKLKSLAAYTQNHPQQPIIWFEDDPRLITEGNRFVREHRLNALLIHTNKIHGISPEDLNIANRWLTRLAQNIELAKLESLSDSDLL